MDNNNVIKGVEHYLEYCTLRATFHARVLNSDPLMLRNDGYNHFCYILRNTRIFTISRRKLIELC